MKTSNPERLETDYLIHDEIVMQRGCFRKVTTALYSFLRSPYTLLISLVGTSVAASAAAVTNFSQELEHFEEGAHEAGIVFPVHSNNLVYTVLTVEMACVGTYFIFQKLKNALSYEMPSEHYKILGSTAVGAALAVAPYISYELLPPQYKLTISIPLSVISATMGGITLYNYTQESPGFSSVVLARSIAGATIFCGILFKIEMKNAEHDDLDTYSELFTSRFGAWLMATTTQYFLTKSIISYNHYTHEHNVHTENNSRITKAVIYSSDLIAFVAREIALYAIISHILEETEMPKDASLALAILSGLVFNGLMSVDDHKELTKLANTIPTSMDDLHEIYSGFSVKICLKTLFSIVHGALESVPLVGVSLGVMNEWKTGEGVVFDSTLRGILAGTFAIVRVNSETQELLELLLGDSHTNQNSDHEHSAMSLNNVTGDHSQQYDEV